MRHFVKELVKSSYGILRILGRFPFKPNYPEQSYIKLSSFRSQSSLLSHLGCILRIRKSCFYVCQPDAVFFFRFFDRLSRTASRFRQFATNLSEISLLPRSLIW
jgi:hypothetical protein